MGNKKATIKLIELFGGIGTQTMAFERIADKFDGIECVDLVEWDQKSVDIYNKVHKTNFLGGPDVGDVNNVRGSDIGSNSRWSPDAGERPSSKIVHNGKDIWVMTCSSPCQSLSNAGLKDGMAPLANEKSSFLWEGIRILRECYELDPEKHTRQPHYFIIENVTPIHNKNNVSWFNTVLREIESYGYNTYVMDVNGNDIGQPQMRARTFVVAALKGVGLKKYIPFHGKPFDEDISAKSRLSKLKDLFNSTSMEDIKEEDDASVDTNKIIIYDGNTHKGIRVAAKYIHTEDGKVNSALVAKIKDINNKIKDAKKKENELKIEVLQGQLFDEIQKCNEKELELVQKSILDYQEEIETLKSRDNLKELSATTTSLADYPFLVKAGLTEEPIKEYAVIDVSFQSTKGLLDAEHCKVYKDKFPTLLCSTNHILILDPKHNCLRRILAKEAWLLQTYTDEAFVAAKDISRNYMGSKKNGLSELYQSLHKTAGDAILVDAFVKVIEPLSNVVSEDDVASPEVAERVTNDEGDSFDVSIERKSKKGTELVNRTVRPSQWKTYKAALDRYNREYNNSAEPFIPKSLADRYNAPERGPIGGHSPIYKPLDKKDNAIVADFNDASLEEAFNQIYLNANKLRESNK